jgi:NADPH-dependent curcumin reductase CurA
MDGSGTNRRFVLVRRPAGRPDRDDFALVDAPLAPLAEGQFRVRNLYASLDPAIRGWLDDRESYMPPVPLGEAVRATTVGEVVESLNPEFPVGAFVVGLHAIETHSIGAPGGFSQRIDPAMAPSLTHFLSVLGAVGLTAWFGVSEILAPGPGDVLLVSGAAGAVGSLAGQIGRHRGARAIGIAGGPEKCRRLIERFGFDAAIDYRGKGAAALAAEIRALAPGGVSHVFENVGGPALDAALLSLKDGARLALCGLISEYNAAEPVGARQLWQLIVRKATMRGFLVSEFLDRFPQGAAAMAALVGQGALRFDEHVEEGIERAYPAFMRLFDGSNEGKMILKL